MLPEIPYHFQFNVPSEFTYNLRPDWFFNVRVKLIGEYNDGTFGIVCELVEPTIWMISGISNWIKLNGLIESAAQRQLKAKLQPLLKSIPETYSLTA